MPARVAGHGAEPAKQQTRCAPGRRGPKAGPPSSREGGARACDARSSHEAEHTSETPSALLSERRSARKMCPTSGSDARSVPLAAMSESDVVLHRWKASGFSLLRFSHSSSTSAFSFLALRARARERVHALRPAGLARGARGKRPWRSAMRRSVWKDERRLGACGGAQLDGLGLLGRDAEQVDVHVARRFLHPHQPLRLPPAWAWPSDFGTAR